MSYEEKVKERFIYPHLPIQPSKREEIVDMATEYIMENSGKSGKCALAASHYIVEDVKSSRVTALYGISSNSVFAYAKDICEQKSLDYEEIKFESHASTRHGSMVRREMIQEMGKICGFSVDDYGHQTHLSRSGAKKVLEKLKEVESNED